MIDVSEKKEVVRVAVAEGRLKLSKTTIALLRGSGRMTEKGNVYETARVAGMLAAKRTRELLPHCHPVRVTSVSVELELEEDSVKASCLVKAVDRTGVEMDALTCVTVALLTVRDMVKKYEKSPDGLYPNAEIRDVKVVQKIKRERYMGVDLRELVKPVAEEISPERLLRKVVAIDAYNALYQFLATIRQPNGEPFTAPDGRVTSHIIGLFYRTINLVELGIKPVYVFDGKPPELKRKTLEKRRITREEARRKRLSALRSGKHEEAAKYARQGAILTAELKEMSTRLLELMGLPRVQAPSEGEAQAAYMAAKGDAYASASQDYDSLLFGTPRLVRNLSVTHKRKLPGKDVRVDVPPEKIELEKLLRYRRLSREQLVDLALLLGTDYNEKPIKGIGPKRALELIRMYGSADRVPGVPDRFKELYPEARRLFLEPEVTDEYELDRDREPDLEGIKAYLVDELGFNERRVENALSRYLKGRERRKQSTIDDFLGDLIRFLSILPAGRRI